MHKEYCIYCGCSNIIHVDEDKWLEQNCHILQCQQCKVMFTELEQRLEDDHSVLDSPPGFDISDEEATLEAVQAAWRSRKDTKANQTLEWLSQHKYPLQHPIEFMIFRDVWQLRDALNSYSILDETKNYDHLYACSKLLDLLANNLQNIDYFLPSYSADKKNAMMHRLHDELILLPAQTIELEKIPAQLQDSFAQTIIQKRASALTACAEQAEYLYTSTHSLDYLKMAAQLLAQCLGHTTVANSSYSQENSKYMRYFLLPKEQYSLTSKHLADITSAIRQTEPNFTTNIPAASWDSLHPHLFRWALTVFIMLIMLLIIKASDYLESIITISYDMLQYILIIGVIFLITVMVLVMYYLNKRYSPSSNEREKENNKRRQLHQRIYE